MTPASAGSPEGRDPERGSIGEADDIAVGPQADAPNTSQVINTPSDLVGEIARELYDFQPHFLFEQPTDLKFGEVRMATWDQLSDGVRGEYLRRAQAILSLLPNGVSVREECAKVARYGRAELEPFVDQAAMDWCGEKDRETFHEDIVYFRSNWQALGGLRAYVVAAAIRAMPLSTLEGEGQ